MSKTISNDINKLKAGLDKVADAVKITIGPRGKNVIIENGTHPIIANDGGRIAKEINLRDPIENMGAMLIKEVVQKTSDDVGGGRTASAIITQAVVTEGLKLINKGFNANLLKKGMNLAVKDICAELDRMAKPVKGKLREIATISTESEELGKVIAETVEKVGLDSVVTVEESQSFGITSEIAEGLKFDKGYISPYMVTNREKLEAEYKDIPVLIIDKKISFFGEIQPILDSLVKKNSKELFIIAEDIDESVLKIFAFSKFNSLFNVLAINTPGSVYMKKYCVEYLCVLTGAEVWTDTTKPPKLGKVKKVLSTKDTTIIQSSANIKEWINTLKTRRELTESKWGKDQYDERIAKLQNGIAIIKVGANSEAEIRYLKLKIEDGVNETKRALEEGIVIGGNCAFINVIKQFSFAPHKNEEIGLGYDIVIKAIEAPLRQIVDNSNGSPDVIIDKIRESKSLTIGYNALDNTIVEDMYKEGIIDAVKVVKSVLQYAVSEAAIFLSIGGDISEEQKDE